jgi:hypothetical protein
MPDHAELRGCKRESGGTDELTARSVYDFGNFGGSHWQVSFQASRRFSRT